MISGSIRFWAAVSLAVGLMGLMAETARAADPVAPAQLADGGYVLMLRHALAPGTGDPPDFELGECSTQRNLNDEGRRQAREIGAYLREAGVDEAQVFTSQWCRCRETAELLDLGPVEELPALNSFYQRPEDREPNLEALRKFLAALPVDGPPVVLVTHQVTITAVTGNWVSSGGGYVLRLDGSEEPPVVGPLQEP
ncbi:MAG: histidine phosphatase family protein [Rhodovibrionaceae bacterium]|nr:histidine phosphatase family protein [Rhodovibrionaceae bacterium]